MQGTTAISLASVRTWHLRDMLVDRPNQARREVGQTPVDMSQMLLRFVMDENRGNAAITIRP